MEANEKESFFLVNVDMSEWKIPKRDKFDLPIVLYNPKAVIPWSKRGYDDSHYNNLNKRYF